MGNDEQISFDDFLKKVEKKFIQKLQVDVDYSADLQRNEEWFEQRKGKFTGSGIKNLMATTRATSKIEWGRAEKTIDFSGKAIKYIYEKAMERKRNKVIHIQPSLAMRYGTENEDVAVELFLEKNKHLKFKNVGFIEFLDGIAGASPDRLIIDTITGAKYGFENKCATNWDTVYSRIEVPFDEKHQDFWQVQAEMLALEVKELHYCVAEPSEDIYEPNITDVQSKIIKASEIHQKAIIDRCKIGNNAIEMFLNQGITINEAVKIAVSNYKFNT